MWNCITSKGLLRGTADQHILHRMDHHPPRSDDGRVVALQGIYMYIYVCIYAPIRTYETLILIMLGIRYFNATCPASD